MTKSKKKPPLGTGERFRAVEKAAAKSGAKDPAAVAAAAGRRKYGQKKMTALAQAGKRRRKRGKGKRGRNPFRGIA